MWFDTRLREDTMDHVSRIARPVQSECPRPTAEDAAWWALQNAERAEAPPKARGRGKDARPVEVEATARLVLMIAGTAYGVSFTPAAAFGPSARAARLTRPDGT